MENSEKQSHEKPSEKTQESNEVQERKESRGRGVVVQIPDEIAKDFDEKLNVSDTEPVVKEESNGFSSSNARSIGGVKSYDENRGLNFSTGNSNMEHEDEKVEETSANSAKEVTSGTPSTKKVTTNKSKYFDHIEPEEMTNLMTQCQIDDPAEFKKIMETGRDLIKCAEENDVAGYHSKILESSNKNLLFWHTSKGFKKALDLFHKEMVDYMLNTLQIDLSHESFKYILHFFINRCISFCYDSAQQRYAAEILEMLLKARKGIANVDEIDPTHGNVTAFQMTWFYGLYELAKKLLNEGCDVNAVDNCGKTPLGLLQLITMKAKIDKNEELQTNLHELAESMKEKGAVLDWKEASK